MHVNLPDSSQFNIKECVLSGDVCLLTTPKDMGVDWNDSNKIFRSSVWRKSDMYPVSLGFKKFTNYGEKPEFEPITDSSDIEYTIKKDGSCLIVSKYKSETIVRTRGTVDATQLSNGSEIELLKKKYSKAFDNFLLDGEDHTFLFEWTTPSNRIVLNETKEPTLWLIGIVSHFHKIHSDLRHREVSYRYFSQQQLDSVAEFLDVERPQRFTFDCISEAVESIKDRTDIEGMVMYADAGQCLKKIKTPSYIHKHRVYTGVKTIDHVIELWISEGCVDRQQFEALLSESYDHELVVAIEHLLNEMYIQWEMICTHVDSLKKLVDESKHLTRKEIAKHIIETAGPWSTIAFNILDSKPNDVKKMFNLLQRTCKFIKN